MAGHVLLWALPAGWEAVELYQPDVEEQIAGRIRRGYTEAGLGPAVAGIVAMELEAARQARDAGVLLWAWYSEGGGTPEDPLRVLSLTLALQFPFEGGAGNGHQKPQSPAPGSASTASMIIPLTLEDPALRGFSRELRTRARPPGGAEDLVLFQVEAFVTPRQGGMLAALSVCTPDPAWEDEARVVAREVAGTLAFLPVDGDYG